MKFFPLLCALFCLWACGQQKNHAPEATPPASTPTSEERTQRGAYLVQISGCNDCHSPKRMGAQGPGVIPETMLSGYPATRPVVQIEHPLLKSGFAMFYPDLTGAVGPWGTSFAANLTPDETGLGSWTFDHFKKAMTQGKSKGLDNGRMLLPPMPWVNYVHMKDEDLKAIFAYLKSIPPVKNLVPAPIPPM